MTQPLISIVIPVWNHAPEALSVLQALRKQTYRHFEVIMVDDGSVDDLEERVRGLDLDFPFQFIRCSENRGAPVARNRGFRASQGEFVIFLDADVILVSHALEVMLKVLLERPQISFVYPSFRFGWKLFLGRTFNIEALRKQNYIHTSALMRREAFPEFDESLKKFQDWDLWLSIVKKGGKGHWIDEVLYQVIPRRAGVMSMSHWVPKFFYQLPWGRFMPDSMKKYYQAEAIIKKKHGL